MSASTAPPAALSPRAILIGLSAGLGFGFLLEKGKVYLPPIIFSQMLFANFTMMKMFLAAIAFSSIAMWVMHTYGGAAVPLMKSSIYSENGIAGFSGNILGGAMVGIGMTLSGACPGTVFPQLAAGIPSAKWTIAGGLYGGLFYAYFHAAMNQNTPPNTVGFAVLRPTSSIDQLLGFKYMWQGMAVVGLSMFAVSLACTVLVPDATELAPYVTSALKPTSTSVLESAWWPPLLTGVGVGLLEFLPLSMNYFLGTSTTFCTLVSFMVPNNMKCASPESRSKPLLPFLGNLRTRHEVYQGALVVGMIAGAYLSLYLSGAGLTERALAECPSTVQAFLGGFFLIFGARIGYGCTSGHGVSGMGRLSVASLIAVASMFAGGIPTAFLLKSFA